MANTAAKVIAIAAAEVGYVEKATNANLDSKTGNAGKNNWTKYARDLDAIPDFYNGKKNGYYWCDVFVDWCFYKAFGADAARALLCQPEKSYGAGCTFSARYYKNKGQLHSTPKPGDQIFFGNKSTHECTHTGLVYAVDEQRVYTIEGNTSGGSGIVANGGCVEKKSYKLTDSGIYGYGRPKYDAEPEKAPEIEKETAAAPSTAYTPKKGDVVYFKGGKHYKSADAATGSQCAAGWAKITATAKGAHPYHLVRTGKSGPWGWVNADEITEQYTPKVGDVVYFEGGKHYKSADAATGSQCAAGTATITATAKGAHPYHLVRTGKSGPYGWVDAGTFTKTE